MFFPTILQQSSSSLTVFPFWAWSSSIRFNLRVSRSVGEQNPATLPETNSEFTPENGCLEDDPASFLGQKAYF